MNGTICFAAFPAINKHVHVTLDRLPLCIPIPRGLMHQALAFSMWHSTLECKAQGFHVLLKTVGVVRGDYSV